MLGKELGGDREDDLAQLPHMGPITLPGHVDRQPVEQEKEPRRRPLGVRPKVGSKPGSRFPLPLKEPLGKPTGCLALAPATERVLDPLLGPCNGHTQRGFSFGEQRRPNVPIPVVCCFTLT